MALISSSQILNHISSFLSETLSQFDLRRRLISTLRREISFPDDDVTLKRLDLASDTLENAISKPNPILKSSSLRLSEQILLSITEDPFSAFLLSLVYSLTCRPIDAASNFLRIFHLRPSLARSEIAQVLYEDLFAIHFLTVFQWFDDQRSRILASESPDLDFDFNDPSNCDQSVVIPCTKLLSRMSEDQTLKLKELERDYEDVLDENCRAFAMYFMDVLQNGRGKELVSPPSLILQNSGRSEILETSHEEKTTSNEEIGWKNGRYNPIWAEGENSVGIFRTMTSRKYIDLPVYPQRVSPEVLINHWNSTISTKLSSESGIESFQDENSGTSSESESEPKEKDRRKALLKPRQSQTEKEKQNMAVESSCSSDKLMADCDNPPSNGKHTPPKDFVCPITSNLFDDPVTLETGQTYERKAIQEWFTRGNSTCPITRQKLQNTELPKTNYVLKRLIASWQEQYPNSVPYQSENSSNSYSEFEPVMKPIMPSTSPTSVINQAAIDSIVSELRHAINNLYMSEVLEESEMAVLQIEKFWKEPDLEVDMKSMLSNPPVINGFVEILFHSVNSEVLKATIFLLAELGFRDGSVIQTLTQVDSDVECIMALFKKGLLEAVVLIYLLRPSTMSLQEMDILDALVTIFKKKEDDLVKMCVKPKTAAVILLAQILGNSEEISVSLIVQNLISDKAMECIIESFEADKAEERIAAVQILLRCMQKDGSCRNIIANKAQLAPIVEIFIGGSDGERFDIVQFFFELVKLNRRTLNEQVLHIIKEEGSLSTMHMLLTFLQTAHQDHCPVVAGLLLQLDILAEPRKMSIYREEAIDTLISSLRNTDFPAAQVTAAETIVSLQGRFTLSGKPLTREILLKRAGLEKNYNQFQVDQNSNIPGEHEIVPEEEKASDEWERKMAFVLASHEFGLLFEALGEGLKSRRAELSSACFVAATWLMQMVSGLPDTGILGAARVCLLKRFISIIKSAKDMEDKALSLLALSSFIHHPDGLHDLASYTQDILKGLRELKRISPLAFRMMNALFEGKETSSQEFWNHKDLFQLDCSENGEVLSVVCSKNKIFSGHSDGTIKVWTVRGCILHLIQDTKEHTKAVTSLVISQSGERLYSGSLDRTAKVWSIGNESIHCVQVHDTKDQISYLVADNNICCFVPQGTGVKVLSLNGGSKLLNPNKHVKCLALTRGKVYCGCHDNSLQEVDLITGELSTIQSGSRKLLGKSNPIQALQIHSGLVYASSSSLDGAAVKIWSTTSYTMVGSLSTTMDVRSMAVSSELIYLGCKGGVVEIWDRKKLSRVDTLQTSTNGKVMCIALDVNEEILVTGTSDGRIQAWGLH